MVVYEIREHDKNFSLRGLGEDSQITRENGTFLSNVCRGRSNVIHSTVETLFGFVIAPAPVFDHLQHGSQNIDRMLAGELVDGPLVGGIFNNGGILVVAKRSMGLTSDDCIVMVRHAFQKFQDRGKSLLWTC